MGTLISFDFEMDNSGASIVVLGEPLHTACQSDGEMDAEVAELKTQLDRVSRAMKRAIAEYHSKPIFKESQDG